MSVEMRENWSSVSRAYTKEFQKRHKLTNLGGKFEQIIRPAILKKIEYAFMLGRNYTNLSTSHEPEILNHDTKDSIIKYLKDEGFKVQIRDRWPGAKALYMTILISWKE